MDKSTTIKLCNEAIAEIARRLTLEKIDFEIQKPDPTYYHNKFAALSVFYRYSSGKNDSFALDITAQGVLADAQLRHHDPKYKSVRVVVEHGWFQGWKSPDKCFGAHKKLESIFDYDAIVADIKATIASKIESQKNFQRVMKKSELADEQVKELKKKFEKIITENYISFASQGQNPNDDAPSFTLSFTYCKADKAERILRLLSGE